MALCRLIQQKSSIQIHRLRFSSATVIFCSSMCSYTRSEKPPQLKNDPVAEDEREMTVEPLTKEFMEAKPGLFSKATFIRNGKGYSWFILKVAVRILKDKIIGTYRQQNFQIGDVSAPSVDPTASMVIASRNVSDQGSGELQDFEPVAKLQNALIFISKDISVNHGTSGIIRDASSDEVVNAKPSEANQMFNLPLPHESKDEDAFNTQSMPTIIASQNSGENYYEEETQTNNSKLDDQETECTRSDEILSTPFLDLGEGLVTNSENSSPLQPLTVVEESEVEEGIDALRSDLTECRKVKQNKVMISNKFLDLESEGGAVSTICNGSEKAVRLVDIFREQKECQTSTVARNKGIEPEESLSNWLSRIANNRESQLQHLSPSENLLPGGASSDLEDANLKESPLSGCKKHLGDDENVRSEGGEVSFPSNETHKIFDSKDCDTKSVNDQIAEEIVKPRNLTLTHQPFEHLNKPCKRGAEKHFDIMDLMNIIKVQEDVTNDNSNMGLVGEDSSNADLQRFDHNDRMTSSDSTATESKVEGEETGDLDFLSVGCMDSKTIIDIPIPIKDTAQKKLNNICFSGEESTENKVLVRFLPKIATERDVIQNFEGCGEILKVEIPDIEGPWFNIAYIYFKTRKGLQKALKVSDKRVKNRFVTVEPTTLMENMTAEVPFPSLICDPDVPAALVKNPSRTVKIQKLFHSISSHHILEAMAFCESNVTGYFLGSSNSVAFVEFETEIGKERALAKHYINVLLRQLTVLRIDAPRTTVVRISNIESLSLKSVGLACKSMGDIRLFTPRSPGILDLHFIPAEWPNMWNILNRLNEVEVGGKRLRAEPAPVFPPEILLVLSQQPEGRKYLKTAALSLLNKLGKTAVGANELASLENILLDTI